MNIKKYALAIGALTALTFVGAGCYAQSSSGANDQIGEYGVYSSVTMEQNATENNQRTLAKAQPPVKLTYSLERENINKRTTLWNDPDKVSYIYLVDYGRVMAFYTIKGKVSSVNSHVTNDSQLVAKCVNRDGSYEDDYCGGVGETLVTGNVPSPAEDGSYGTNGDAVFFFTTDGVYVEWNGKYVLVDQPLQFTSQPELVRQVK